MIAKERLQELIEQGATIYTTYGGYLSDIQLNRKYDYVTDNHLFEADMVAGEVGYRKYTFNILFETIEDAEWYREFGCIERTEKLELPTWEELFKEDRILDCYTQEFGIVKNRSFIEVVLFGVDFTNEIVEVSIGSDQIFCELLTKENYTLACRKAKELFLGLGENK